jgi:hypothetical protein
MRTHRNEDHADPSAEPRQADSDAPGLFGYGHRAHMPDPDASYGFDPGPRRVLPVEEHRRWRVTG